MSSPISDVSDPPPPRRRPVASDDDDDDDDEGNARSESPPPKPAAEVSLDDMFSEDDDGDNAPSARSRPQPTAKDSDDGLQDDDDDDLGDDLFGDGSDMGDPKTSAKVRTLDDREIDSGDDLDADPRRRIGNDVDDDMSEEERDETSYEVDIGLHKLPQSSDDQVYLLKIPQFISIAPQIFKPETFQAPKLPPDAAITPYTFATTAIRWRRSAADPSKLESNSRIIKWSDGSFSLQIGSSKEGLYDLPTNQLIPPKNTDYNPAHDSFTFLAEPLANSRLVRFFSHATQSMGVVSASDSVITDDIKQMVAARYKATQKRRGNEEGLNQMDISYKVEDPERARREAEAVEREVEKSRKKIEAQRNKEAESAGANGYRRRYRRGDQALTLDELEEGNRERPRGGGGGGGGYRGKKVREDDYDEDDGFVEADPDSDEEEEIMEDSDEEEEYDSRRKKEKKKKHKSKSKRREEENEDDEDEEPEAEFTGGEEDDDDQSHRRAKSPSKPKARSASEAEDREEQEDELSRAPERKRRRLVMDSDEE
ncbi:hypothetical protein DRE_00102 [Drechslerella stenobrocha 248]|uniref:Leo1-like protein n=1 Tax=Drechslerella stenobrocha 248 TaxID=1043628 RepID=W7I9N0_9PEZI|nr:hypothetical protein DRE_00102 [Drechslerella stenobrocha 248]